MSKNYLLEYRLQNRGKQSCLADMSPQVQFSAQLKKKKGKLFIRKNIKIYNFRRKNYGITFPSELDRKKIKRSVKNQQALPYRWPTWPHGILHPIKTEHTLQTQKQHLLMQITCWTTKNMSTHLKAFYSCRACPVSSAKSTIKIKATANRI